MGRNEIMKNLLDDLSYIRRFDKSDMLCLLMNFPEQISEAIDLAAAQPVCVKGVISNVVLSGLGGSAIGGDIIRCCLADEIKVPFLVNRDYCLPDFVDSKTLFLTSSYSGNTEETISAYKYARAKKAKIVVISSGGTLEGLAKKDGYPFIRIPGGMPPRCALGYSLVPVLSVLSNAGLIKDKQREIKEAIEVLTGQRDNFIGSGVLFKDNIAKKTAALLSGKFAAIYGWSKNFDCVITRWRNQLNENSKTLAISHFLPEMDHNEIMGFSHPKKLLKSIVVIFLRDRDDHPRVKDRIRITSSVIKDRVGKIIEIKSAGKSLLARICSLIYIGDFVSFYLAIANKEDPTPVDEITYLKKELAKTNK